MKDPIVYDDFAKLDIRVGQVKQATAPDWSRKLLQFTVDFGPEVGERTIFSGIKEHYQPEDLIGKKAMFVINLEPKKMGDSESQGMMLMADSQEKPTLVWVPDEVALGTQVR